MADSYLKRTPSSAGNRKTFTMSTWIKRSKLSYNYNMFYTAGTYNSTQMSQLYFANDDKLRFGSWESNGNNNHYLETYRVFRDVSAWYHIVVAVDTTQATASNRVKIYINGVQETLDATNNYPSQNHDYAFNSTLVHNIGRREDLSSSYHEGYLSHVIMVDGAALAPTVFGSTDATTGEWKINTAPSVTWGTNGFHILKDNNSGTDQSTNSNNFTANGNLTKSEDCPSNVFCTMNPLSPQNYTFTNGNNTMVRAGSASTAIGTLAANSGKWYWEAKLVSGQSDYPRIGIYEMNSDNHIYTTYLGNASGGTGKWWGSGGTSSSNKKIQDGNGTTIQFYPYDNGDILMFAMDNDNEKLWFGKNGTWYTNDNSTTTTGTAISNNTATPAFSTVTAGKFWTPGIFGNDAADVWSANFGNGYFGTTAVSSAGTNASGIGIFEYDVPSGFTALSTKGLNL